MTDPRPLAPILAHTMSDDQITEIAHLLREWAGVDWLDATVDDLREARLHQQLYLDALEHVRVQRLAEAGIVALDQWRKGRR